MERFPVGRIIKAQGIKGEVKIASMLDDSSEFVKMRYLYIDGQRIAIVKARVDKSFAYILFSTITDRNQAETLKNKMIYADREQFTLPEGRFFIDDVIGCEVKLDNGESLGLVAEIMQNPAAADVYVVEKDGETKLFPLLKDITVKIDIEEKLIVLKADGYDKVAISYGANED